ncbi:MAG: hypothetical protein ACYS72_05605 [Planctomycetota bacterium]|jgi:hypothetical protein
MRNAFVALCDLASENRWCWKIHCTTCASSDLRISFQLLLKGHHPDHSSNWNNMINSILKDHSFNLREIVHISNMDRQTMLLNIVSQASIKEIREVALFPDWLGYIGLVMFACEETEFRKQILANSISPQFISELKHTPVASSLRSKLENDSLWWKDLEIIEDGYMQSDLKLNMNTM